MNADPFAIGLTQADFPTVIGVTLDREDGSTPMETDGDKGKQGGTTYYIDTNQLRVPRESMEVMSPLKNGMSECQVLVSTEQAGDCQNVVDFEVILRHVSTMLIA